MTKRSVAKLLGHASRFLVSMASQANNCEGMSIWHADAVKLGAEIQRRRESAGIGIERMVTLTSLDEAAIRAIEGGTYEVTLLDVVRIGSALGVRAEDILRSAGI